jgi:hypothetical protein
MPLEMTDTQKLRAVPKILETLEVLMNTIAGDIKTGEPGLLEVMRGIRSDVTDIKAKQESLAQLEVRIKAIEDRHRAVDEAKKKKDSYYLAVWGMVITNIGIIIMSLLGFIK